jgi:hypothetical protein
VSLVCVVCCIVYTDFVSICFDSGHVVCGVSIPQSQAKEEAAAAIHPLEDGHESHKLRKLNWLLKRVLSYVLHCSILLSSPLLSSTKELIHQQ